jgi:hypothetical protein
MIRIYHVSYYYRVGGHIVLNWDDVSLKKYGWPAVVCTCAKDIMRLEFTWPGMLNGNILDRPQWQDSVFK